MNNNHYPSPSQKLPTNRSFLVSFIRGVCSFAILYILDEIMMSRDLRIIIERYTGKKPALFFTATKNVKIINNELARRNINFKPISSFFPSPSRMVEALNLLSADYNING